MSGGELAAAWRPAVGFPRPDRCGAGRPARAAAAGRRRLVGSRATALRARAARLHPARPAFRSAILSAGYSVPAFLHARLAAGHPPDVAFLPQPGLLRRYASEHLLVPLDQIAGAEVADNFYPAWRRLGSFGGKLYGVWFKAANKSLIWYNIGVFERAGIVPPGSLTTLVPTEYALARSGTPAFTVGGADGWTLADWFSNLYLRMAGPARYDLLAAHRIPWTDPSVKATLRLLAQVLAPGLIAGGPHRALATSYQESVQETFARHPAAAMVFEGDFVAGVISAETSAVPGVDADVAPFPVAGSRPGGGRRGRRRCPDAPLSRRGRVHPVPGQPAGRRDLGAPGRLRLAEHQPGPVRVPRRDRQIDRACPARRPAPTSASAFPIWRQPASAGPRAAGCAASCSVSCSIAMSAEQRRRCSRRPGKRTRDDRQASLSAAVARCPGAPASRAPRPAQSSPRIRPAS